MSKSNKVLILGSTGMVGSSIYRNLSTHDYINLLTPSSKELNLTNQKETLDYFKKEKPQKVILAAAKVGGIHANDTFRADFIFQNLCIQNNVFQACFKFDVEQMIFLGSSCIYPRECPQPIKEEYLLTGPLESTNEPYAIAKIAGLKTAENFRRQYGKNYISLMPTNLYGENDNFHPTHGHVIPGLICRMEDAIAENKPIFEVWGSGKPKREFLHVDDLSEACRFTLEYENEDLPYWMNVGTGSDISINELARLLADIMCFKGELKFNTNYPDGTPRKLLDVSKIQSLGWKHSIRLEEGLRKTVDYYRSSPNIRRH